MTNIDTSDKSVEQLARGLEGVEWHQIIGVEGSVISATLLALLSEREFLYSQLIDSLPEVSIEGKKEPDDYEWGKEPDDDEWDFALSDDMEWGSSETDVSIPQHPESTNTRPNWIWRAILVLMAIGSLASIANG